MAVLRQHHDRAGLTPVMVAVLTFALNISAYVAELLRSALEAADGGQAAAARPTTLSPKRKMDWVWRS